MGMTIDDALNLLNNSKPKSNNAFSIQMNEAINIISKTIRKYQIIVNDLEACEQDRLDFISVKFLKEVIDGNVD